MTFTMILFPKRPTNKALHWEKGVTAASYLHTLWLGEGGSLLQAELKGLMDHSAYLILKMCRPWKDPCHIVQISAATPSLCPWLRPAEERRAGRRKRSTAASVGFAVAMETLSSLLNTCFDDITCQDCPLKERNSSQFNTQPASRDRPVVDGWVWWWGGGFLWDNND